MDFYRFRIVAGLILITVVLASLVGTAILLIRRNADEETKDEENKDEEKENKEASE